MPPFAALMLEGKGAMKAEPAAHAHAYCPPSHAHAHSYTLMTCFCGHVFKECIAAGDTGNSKAGARGVIDEIVKHVHPAITMSVSADKKKAISYSIPADYDPAAGCKAFCLPDARLKLKGKPYEYDTNRCVFLAMPKWPGIPVLEEVNTVQYTWIRPI